MIEIAYAQEQAASAGGGGGTWLSVLPLVLMILIFYFLLIRPQQKKEKDRQAMIKSLQKGDRVITASGIYGIVDSFGSSDDSVFLKVSGNTKIEFSKNAIQSKV